MIHASTPAQNNREREEGADLMLVGEGFSTRVLRSPTGYIVRLPKHHHAANRQAMLARLLPVAIPIPRALLPEGPAAPYGGLVYEELPGVTMPAHLPGDPVTLAETAGSFLAILHAITPAHLDTRDAELFPDRDEVDGACAAVMRTALTWIRDTEPSPVHERLIRWWDGFQSARDRATFTPSLVHGDVWYGNILVDDAHTRLLGVLDWENVAFDDPAQDVTTLLHSGDMFCAQVLGAYRDAGGLFDGGFLGRRQRHWEYREFTGLAAAIDAHDQGEIDGAMRS